MSRKTARVKAFCLIFENSISKKDKDELLDDFLKLCNNNDNDEIYEKIGDNDWKYIKDVVSGTLSNISKIDDIIVNSLVGWEIDRVAKVNLAVLRLAVYEMFYREDIPIKVIINEAVEIAKIYQGEEAAPFINGTLGAIANKVKR